jgi:hypothetical protein
MHAAVLIVFDLLIFIVLQAMVQLQGVDMNAANAHGCVPCKLLIVHDLLRLPYLCRADHGAAAGRGRERSQCTGLDGAACGGKHGARR